MTMLEKAGTALFKEMDLEPRWEEQPEPYRKRWLDGLRAVLLELRKGGPAIDKLEPIYSDDGVYPANEWPHWIDAILNEEEQ